MRRRGPWFVYMLECAGGRVYTGISNDVDARFATHRAGRGGAFTRSFPPSRVLGAKRCRGHGAALKAEYALKQLAPADKARWAAEFPWPSPCTARRGARTPRRP